MTTFRDPLGTEFHKIKQTYNVPPFVKSANQRDLRPEGTPEELYRVCADPVNLTYPCHTKAATWLSAAFLAEDYEKLPQHYRTYVGNRIEKFAKFFGIENEIQDLVAERTQTVKQASASAAIPSDWYAVEMESDGQKQYAGAMIDQNGVRKAAQWLLQNRNAMPLHQCSGIAQRIYKRAASLGMEEAPEREKLEQIIGFGFNDNDRISQALVKRAELGRSVDPELSNTLVQMAQIFQQDPPEIGSAVMYKTACFIDEFDHRTGLSAMRSRGELPLPEEVIYRHTLRSMEKYAASNLKLQNGSIYSLDSISRLDRDSFEGRFGSDLANECYVGREFNKEAAAAILPTLPRPMADQLTQELHRIGVRPDHQEKAAAVVIPPEFFS